MTSVAFARIEARFADRPPLDLVACARTLSRGHAAYAIELTGERAPSRSAEARGRQIARAHELDYFWATIALHAALIDLEEEHAEGIPSMLMSDLTRLKDKHARDIVDPLFADSTNTPLRLLLPPRRHLPDHLPAALIEIFGEDLARPPTRDRL